MVQSLGKVVQEFLKKLIVYLTCQKSVAIPVCTSEPKHATTKEALQKIHSSFFVRAKTWNNESGFHWVNG